MATQGPAQSAVKATQVTPNKNTTTVAPAKAEVAPVKEEVAPVKTQETTKMAIDKKTLEELVNKDMSLRTMAEKLNAKVSEVRNALTEFGLQTKSMKSGGSKKASTIQTFDIICAIKHGAGSEELIVKETGISETIVKNTVRKMKKEGLVKNAITFVEQNKSEPMNQTG